MIKGLDNFIDALLLECMFQQYIVIAPGGERNTLYKRHFIYKLQEIVK